MVSGHPRFHLAPFPAAISERANEDYATTDLLVAPLVKILADFNNFFGRTPVG
jgi:hypothetical protein